jgi:hypothetical protein
MNAANSLPFQPVQTSAPIISPSLINIFDAPGVEPPTPEEWRRALRVLAVAFLQQFLAEGDCVTEARLIAAHKLIEARRHTAH